MKISEKYRAQYNRLPRDEKKQFKKIKSESVRELFLGYPWRRKEIFDAYKELDRNPDYKRNLKHLRRNYGDFISEHTRLRSLVRGAIRNRTRLDGLEMHDAVKYMVLRDDMKRLESKFSLGELVLRIFPYWGSART